MVSWRARPTALSGEWTAYRQTQPGWPALFHEAGEREPNQPSARWHRQGDGYVQYLSLSALGAWAECARHYEIDSPEAAAQMRRDLWLVFVREDLIADLSTFRKYAECGLDPRIAVGEHSESQELADRLRADGYRGLLSPSAALPGATNLTLFGERFEHETESNPAAWSNPSPDDWLAVQRLAERAPLPIELPGRTVFPGDEHDGFEQWKATARRGGS